MADNENIYVEVSMDTNKIETKLKDISSDTGDIKTVINSLKGTVDNASVAVQSSIDKIGTALTDTSVASVTAVKDLAAIAAVCTNSIIQEINNNFSSLFKAREEDANINAGYKIGDWLLQIIGIMSASGSPNGDGASGTSKGSKKEQSSWQSWGLPTYPALPAPSESGQQAAPSSNSDRTKNGNGGSPVNGVVSNALSSTGGSLSDIMDFGTSADDLVQSIGNVIIKLKESAAAWGAQMAAKIADKAVDLQIIALYAADYIKQFGVMVGQLAASTAAWVGNTAAKVASTAAEWAQIAATTAWNAICAAATAVTTALGAAMTFLTSPIGLVVIAIAALIAIVVLLVKNWDTVKAVALSVWEAIKAAFGKAWQWFKDTLLDPLVNGFKGMVNGVIGFINGLIAGAVKGINGIINVLNKLKFTVPDWVPGLGGATIGFNLKTVTAPQIPYLAKGAVLPANRPFLAMVGDQRHGTNIEAPLTTIQEAMALTMEDFVASNMAGHEATVGVLREILGAVLGIHIGDTVIAQATERYRSKMAVVRGGSY